MSYLRTEYSILKNLEPTDSVSLVVNSEPKDSFFTFPLPENANANDEVSRYLDDTDLSLQSLNRYSIIKQLFLKYNAPTPSSAPVERLFSAGGLIRIVTLDAISWEINESECFCYSNTILIFTN